MVLNVCMVVVCGWWFCGRVVGGLWFCGRVVVFVVLCDMIEKLVVQFVFVVLVEVCLFLTLFVPYFISLINLFLCVVDGCGFRFCFTATESFFWCVNVLQVSALRRQVIVVCEKRRKSKTETMRQNTCRWHCRLWIQVRTIHKPPFKRNTQ